MIFFTDIQTHCSRFCLLNIKKYESEQKQSKLVCFIDPSVYELKENMEYSNIEKLHWLANGNLKENEFISIDYPCDMNLEYSELFVEKSIKNNLKYADNEQYICTIQSKFQDFKDFVYQFEYLEDQIDFSRKIIGIGNLCRILHPNQFSDEVFKYLNSKPYIFHFYGLGMRLIKKYSWFFTGLRFSSIDSTKWTKSRNKEVITKYGQIICTSSNRDDYFLTYMREIRKMNINVFF